MSDNAFKSLRKILATLYPDLPSIRRIADDAGIDSSRIEFSSTAINCWHAVLTEAKKLDQIEALLHAVESEYGSNTEFLKACQAYRQSTGSQPVEYHDIVSLVMRQCESWKQANYSGRGNNLIDYETFKRVNKYRTQLARLDAECLAFLLRCAVQNGASGEWGPWLLLNRDNERIVYPLLIALNGAVGRKPMWRAGYILECTFGKIIESLRKRYSSEIDQSVNMQLVLNTIAGSGVLSYLNQLIQSDDKRADDAIKLVDEIQGFQKDIAEYKQVQTVQAQWLALSSNSS